MVFPAKTYQQVSPLYLGLSTVLRKKRSLRIAIPYLLLQLLLLLLLYSALTLPEAAFAIGGPPPVEMRISPQSQSVQIGGSATFDLQITVMTGSRIKNFTLSTVNSPQGVTATFNPSTFADTDKSSFTSKMTVKVAEDAPPQKTYLNVQGIAITDETRQGEPVSLMGGDGVLLTIYAVAPVRTTTAATTITVTMENTRTQTVTSTSIQTSAFTTTLSTDFTNTVTTRLQDQAAEPPAYAWAVSATVAAVVIAVMLVMQRRRK